MILLALLLASSSVAPNAEMVSEFGKTCVASKSKSALMNALSAQGWRAYPVLSQSRLEHEIAAVSPMLEAQGLASDYTIYYRDNGGRHLELALSETKKPIKDGRKLIGCSLYDFEAIAPVDSATLQTFAPPISSRRSVLGDVIVEKWESAFGEYTGMRAVFVPPASPMKAQLGFTGMMLGTHFLDAVN